PEHALRDPDGAWPVPPARAPAVTPRRGAEPRPRARRAWRRRPAAVAAAALLALAGGTLAVPEARSTVFDWLGIESVEIRRAEPNATPGASLNLGLPSTIERLGVPVLQPRGLGEPGVYATTLPDGTRAATLVYDGPVLVQTFRAQASPFIDKTVGTGATVTRLIVDGATAFWIAGAHGFAYQSEAGFGFEDQRIAGSTLLVERRDGLLLRIEGVRDRDRALAIARSVQ
ncbi:hypothetical protein OJ962_27390, partial [Solirubrobacter sp. CPCC 204708]